MLTFTEFFTKKKIDIIALQKSRPDLYQEFDRDYALMGEKSFDHSKKFWFNRLRKEFLLEEIEIPAEEKKELVKPDVTSSVNVESKSTEVSDPGNTTAKPAGFKPRFKSGNIKKPAEVETPKKEETTDSVKSEATTAEATGGKEKKAVKPAGFKPRFKASNLPKPAVTETPKVEETQDSVKQEAPAAEVSATEAPPAEEKKAVKPAGFKPRFKASNLPKPVVTETSKEVETTDSVKQEAPAAEVSAAETPASEEKKAVKPAGFKPRFKASNLPKPVVTETSKEVETTDSVKQEAPAAEVSAAETPAAEEKKAVKPAGFKPRFKASNLPKKLEGNPEEGKTNKTEDKKDKEDDN
ncbi:hypothetical protein [Sphingobacterium sp. CZ-2]|uniref:hypothetical protein n=1 Tax=Sphingobacterium sp. CZ-2 TaxID=2557994 RepID=UPI00107014FF|nr:hypothetical protein [Sphingobacterium sp. CZ-2]QBR10851.1 hypothetical protein E3D81_01170 [Sphingobacterium sp. CZ-2]